MSKQWGMLCDNPGDALAEHSKNPWTMNALPWCGILSLKSFDQKRKVIHVTCNFLSVLPWLERCGFSLNDICHNSELIWSFSFSDYANFSGIDASKI